MQERPGFDFRVRSCGYTVEEFQTRTKQPPSASRFSMVVQLMSVHDFNETINNCKDGNNEIIIDDDRSDICK